MSDGVFWPEFEAWLRAHGIEPNDCYEIRVTWTPSSVHPAGSWDGPVRMEVSLWRVNDQGDRYLDETGDAVSVTRMIPMRHLPAVEVVRSVPARQGGTP